LLIKEVIERKSIVGSWSGWACQSREIATSGSVASRMGEGRRKYRVPLSSSSAKGRRKGSEKRERRRIGVRKQIPLVATIFCERVGLGEKR
jgi:hypothetical protein